MANKITIFVDVVTDRANSALGNFKSSIADADGAMGKFRAGAASVGNSLKANAIPLIGAAGVAFAAFATKAIGAASDLSESTNAVNKTFGDAADGVLEVGENAARSFGLSKSAFNDAAVSFSSFAKTVAGEGGDVAGVIEELVGRSADFASVMNLDVAEAATVFRSALSGETEPIKKFGIDLSAAAVESFALAEGLVESAGAMSEATKVQARYGLLLRSTKDVAGDFSDTSDGLANSSRILAGETEDLAAMFGETLIPAAEGAVAVLLDMIEVAQKFGLFQEQNVKAIAILSESQVQLAKTLDAAGKGGEFFNEVIKSGATSMDEYARITLEAAKEQHSYEQRSTDATRATSLAAVAFDNATGTIRDANKALADHIALTIEAAGGAFDMESATLELASAMDAQAQATSDANDVLADSESTDAEKTEALRNLRLEQIGNAGAALELAQAYAEESGAAEGSATSAQLQIDALSMLKGQYPGIASDIQVMIDKLLEVPGTVDSSTFDIGAAMAQGIADGIGGSAWEIGAALKKAVNDGKISARTAARIQSPSRLFAEEVGQPIAEGLAEGIAEDAHKIGEALAKAIESAEKDAVAAATDLVDAAGDVLDDVWGGIDGSRSEADMRMSVVDAQKALNEAIADGDVDRMSKATERLEDANFRLAKATSENVMGDAALRASWIETALAGGLTVTQIDSIISAMERLDTAKLTAVAARDAIAAEATGAQATRARFGELVGQGLVSADQINHLKVNSDPGFQLSVMGEIIRNLDAFFGSIPGMATGGTVKASPGGTIVRLGEGGRDERVTPVGAGGGGNTINVAINVNGGDPQQVVNALRQFVRRNGPIQGLTA